MNPPIDYTAEARQINELVSMEDRENAYVSLASRLREERDVSMANLTRVEDLLKEAGWQEPQVGQLPFDRGYNLAMMQVNRVLTGSNDASPK